MGDSAMLHSDLEALIGAVLHDRYHVESLLGVGGMGAVFKARHTGLERDVAIKVLHPEIGRDASVSKRFDREATSASRLDHPNCVRVTDFGTTDSGTKYLVMELLEGEELLDRLARPWPPAAMVRTAKQILAGLEHAHHFGIVHRDLKPENVFVTKDFRGEEIVKLVDFGIAKLIDEQGAEKLTRAGIVFGTPRYMSPEQAAGGKIDERTDLYAVGLIFYEMLAGRAPFESDETAALLRMQIMAPPPPLPDSVPAPLAAIVQKLLEKSKMDRYASAREVIDALDEVEASLAPGVAAAAGPLPGTAAAAAAAAAAAPTGALVTAPTSAVAATAPPTGATAEHPGHSGSAWQPASTGPVRSGATISSESAGLAPATGQTLAYASGSAAQIPVTRTGGHPGVGQPATGPFDSLAAAQAPSASNPAGWTGANPTLGSMQQQQQPVSGAYPTVTGSHAALEDRRPAWIPWVIAAVALMLAIGAVAFAMSSGDSETSDTNADPDPSSERSDAPAASPSQAATPAEVAPDAVGEGGEASAAGPSPRPQGSGSATKTQPAPDASPKTKTDTDTNAEPADESMWPKLVPEATPRPVSPEPDDAAPSDPPDQPTTDTKGKGKGKDDKKDKRDKKGKHEG